MTTAARPTGFIDPVRATARPVPRLARAAPAQALPMVMMLAGLLYVMVTVLQLPALYPPLLAVPWGKVSFAVVLASALVGGWTAPLRRFVATRSATCQLIIFALAVASIPTALWGGGAVVGAQLLFTNIVGFLMVGLLVSTEVQAARLFQWFSFGSAAIGVHLVLGRETTYGRAFFGPFDPNDVSAICVAGIPVALAAFRTGRSSLRFVHLGVAFLLLLATLRTQSRGGFLALCAVGLVGLAIGTWKQRAMTFAGVIFAVLIIAVAGDQATKTRFRSILNPREDYNSWTTDGRIEVWKRGLGFMVTHPLLGVGIANYEIADGTLSEKALVRNGRGIKFSAAHNAYVQIGAELGFGGLIAFLGMLFFAMRDAERTARKLPTRAARLSPASIHRTLLRASVMSLSSILVSAVFLSFAYSAALMFFVAMTAGLAVASRSGRQHESPVPIAPRRRR